MKAEIIHIDGRRINLAGAIDPATYAELEKTTSPRLQPVLWCGGCGGGIYIKHGIVRKDELFGTHHHTGNCSETLVIRKSVMSDQHKRQAEYHAAAAERAGHVGDLEVITTGHTRVDVVVDGKVGFEIQRSALGKAAAVDRTARSVSAGLDTVAWFTDRATSTPWTGYVPGYRTLIPVSAWLAMPLPGTVSAAGLMIAEAARCGSYGPCLHRRPCNRYVPALVAWAGLRVDDVVTGLAEDAIRPVRIGKLVRLMSADSIALYEELAGTRLGYDAGNPKARMMAPSPRQDCGRPQARAPSLLQSGQESPLGPWAECSRCRRRYRPASPAGRCYDCQYNIPVQGRTA